VLTHEGILKVVIVEGHIEILNHIPFDVRSLVQKVWHNQYYLWIPCNHPPYALFDIWPVELKKAKFYLAIVLRNRVRSIHKRVMGILVTASMAYQYYVTFPVRLANALALFQLIYPVNYELHHHWMVRKRLCYHELQALVSSYLGTLLDSVFQLHSRVQEIWHHSDKARPRCHALADSFGNEWRQYLKEGIIYMVVSCPLLC